MLFIVSTPIGNPADISSRAIEVLRNCDIVLCEELKPARRLLAGLKIQKELIELNEHTTKEATHEALTLLMDGKSLALISDDGTPLLADPGSELVRECIRQHIPISPIPGASSVLAALVASGFSLLQFTFVGFLPRDKNERKTVTLKYRTHSETLIFLEAPYRLNQLLDDLSTGIGPKRNAVICMNLTMPSERFERGTLANLRNTFNTHPFKGEFVVVVEGAGGKLLPKR
jgi:16S rRNA (cytidine1402-2'-O)-methyltransferase